MKRFKWNTARSREDCIAVTAIRMFLKRCSAEEALQQSLDRYCTNGDQMSVVERRKVLSAARKRSSEAHQLAEKTRDKVRQAM